MYKQFKNINGDVCGVIRVVDGASIPFDPANTDYQAYLKFLEEGGVPEPAEVTE
jgi:hypothetical protein